MSNPADRLTSRSFYPLLAVAITSVLPLLFNMVLLGPDRLKRTEIWFLSVGLGVCIGAVTLFCQYRMREEALELSEDRFAAVSELAREINSSLDLGEAFHEFTTNLRDFLPVDRATISLAEDGEEYRIFALSARHKTELEQGRYYPLQQSRVAWVMSNGKPTISEDITKESYWDWEALAEEGLRSVIDIPLHTPAKYTSEKAGPIIGVFSVYAQKMSAYRKNDIEFLANLAEHLACTLSNARRHEEGKERIRWLEMMHSLEVELGEALQVEEALRIVSDHAVKAIRADRILAVLPKEMTLAEGEVGKETRLHLAGPGIDKEAPWHQPSEFGPLVVEAIERKAPMLSRLVAEEALSGTPLEPIYYSEGVRSMAVMPILIGVRLLGVLIVGWREEGAVSQENLQMLQELTSHLGVALRNAGLKKAAGGS